MQSEELARRVEEAVDELPFSVVVVFGSRSRDTARSESDLDVAVLPTARAEVDRRRLQARAASVLADLAPGGRVDVVFLDEAPELLRQRIMETGRVIVCREPARWRELRVRTMREHADREPYRRLLREAQHRRLTEGLDGRSGRAVGSLERARGHLAELRGFLEIAEDDFVREPAQLTSRSATSTSPARRSPMSPIT